ncbi:conserved hypothetical protein [Talaromyces stipitatus ATCC 10500]|uniref:Uncharacterized protein n=1 Tax=Talaromyces stipitatus (strain ATCC 10500 / CBS 375.48 / QM 6759 / NRRL 1006) TaxID=441959 RepID=B8LYL3_TALSN|nr:uncharacterized protein TSTA_067990 [Talaromyces stipitatus ATCC 10500]EED23371.1 conserved hypothetical protein [Talaromyces stipitatus ATCC 10500]
MPFLTTTSSDRGYSPVAKVRDLEADESFVLTEYETHARKCTRCIDALDAFREGRLLCERGLGYARDVANYIFTKSGKAYSAVDNEHDEEVLVRIPREYKASRRLLLAIEEGLRLRRDQPIVSYDATYPVGARRPAENAGAGGDDDETVTEIIERAPRTRRRVIIYRRTSPGRTSSSRGSLYEADRVDRQERRQYIRVSRFKSTKTGCNTIGIDLAPTKPLSRDNRKTGILSEDE